MKKILEKVAIEYEVPIDEVEIEIAKALEMGRKDKSEDARKFWESVSNQKDSISMEEVFAAIISEVYNRL